MPLHHISGLTIRTNFDYPPIPVRQFDWSAIDDDTYDGAEDSHCPIGHGATEEDAIEDLLEQIDDDKIAANSQFGVGA